jgi:hypothetical protein
MDYEDVRNRGKIARIGNEEMLMIMSGNAVTKFPRGSKVSNCHYNYACRSFDILLLNENFPMVEEGCMFPVMEDLEIVYDAPFPKEDEIDEYIQFMGEESMEEFPNKVNLYILRLTEKLKAMQPEVAKVVSDREFAKKALMEMTDRNLKLIKELEDTKRILEETQAENSEVIIEAAAFKSRSESSALKILSFTSMGFWARLKCLFTGIK